MKALIAAALTAAAFAAHAGEDSTHRWGPGGTGPNWWDTPCGLKGFAQAKTETPCTEPLPAEMSLEEMRAWIAQHQKVMDDMMSRMSSEHRAMMGAMGKGAPAAADGVPSR